MKEDDPLTQHELDEIDDAVARDYEWLTGEAQEIEGWEGTTPDEVDPLDMPDGSVMFTLNQLTLDQTERYDRAIEYVEECWEYMRQKDE